MFALIGAFLERTKAKRDTGHVRGAKGNRKEDREQQRHPDK